jgi:hypothetical protein
MINLQLDQNNLLIIVIIDYKKDLLKYQDLSKYISISIILE